MNALVLYHRRSLTFLLFLFCLPAMAWAQPKAAFSATPVSGCSPLVVYFTDNSTGSPTQWKWDLGNGVTSFLRHPSATYFNPGTYSVKLVVSNADGRDSVIKTQFIRVAAAPAVDFGFDKKAGCFPLPVKFTDKSIPGSGSITSWQWDFGDGTISHQQNPLHTFTAPGNFSITLRVTNSVGCIKTFTLPQAIQVSNGVKAAFNTSGSVFCTAPATAQFTNGSTGPGPLQYQWTFGDSSASQAANPSHTYTKNGSYTVSLIATIPLGCADTLRKDSLIRIGAAKAAFAAPSTTCINETVSFTTTSTTAPLQVKWDFGDGTTSTELNPVKTFTRPGKFTVQLIGDFGNCADTVKKQITVAAPPSAAFSTAKQQFCSMPASVSFTSQATGSNLHYAWDFGDSTTSTAVNPTYSYTREGSYTVRLIVTNAGGCSDTLVQKDFITIQKPQIQLTGLPRNGCTPLTVTPSASLITHQRITGYYWDFGDGTTFAGATPSHTYTKTGSYTVSLIATTEEGCTDTVSVSNAVRVGEKPRAAFVNQPQTVCANEFVSLTDKSTGSVDQWYWDFGDGMTSTLQHPTHQYTDTGWQTVTLVVYNHTCADTVVFSNAVYVNPPVPAFSVTDDCDDKYSKRFTDGSLGAKTWSWEFGDGHTSTQQHPVHTYAHTGTYTVRLTVTNGNCSNFTVRTVMVIDEKASFSTPDSLLCRNHTAAFTATANSSQVARWQWNFGDGNGSQAVGNTSHRFTKAGNYTVTLAITDLLGCTSDTSLPVNVFGPTAGFTPSVSATCLKDNRVSFQENSLTDGQHPIAKRVWNFGDGSIDSLSTAPYNHSYTAAGTYNVSLLVTDIFGCSDSLTRSAAVVIAQPVAAFTAKDTLTCTGKTVQFTNDSEGISRSFQWSFGDGTGSTYGEPRHSYKATGVYTVKLVVTDQYGCKDSVLKPGFITVSYPKAAFTVSDSVGTCPPLLVNFTNTSAQYTRIAWDFGDGSRSALDSPSHFYTVPGTFYATLVATGPGGCTDTARQRIVVNGPSGTFRYTPLTGCNPLTVNFTANTHNTASIVWDYSDGSTAASKTPASSHTYVTPGDYVPKVILTDAAGCSVPIEGKDTIRVKDVAADFSMSETTFCDKGTVQFSNHTVGNDFITGYQWRFGDGSTSTAEQPSHTYNGPGGYTVQLQVSTQSGCTDKKVFTDTIKVFQSPHVEIEGDSAACAPASFAFKGRINQGDSSQLTWKWNMANGRTAEMQNPLSLLYTQEGSYTISTMATDNHGCSHTAEKKVTVFPTPQTDAGADQWICRGSFYQLKATGATTYQWKTAPSLSCTDCNSPLAVPTDSTQYIVTGFNSFGCSLTDSVTLRVHQPFSLRVEKGDTICVGQSVLLSATGASQYTWLPSTGIKNPSAGVTTATPQTSTQYKVIAKDKAGCFMDTGFVNVKVWPKPTIKAETVHTLPSGQTLTLQPVYSGDVSSYQWSPAQTLSCDTCPWPVAHPKTETTYTVVATNDGGCSAREEITVKVVCNGGNLFIPNTFSPNADGQNDVFYPRGTGIGRIRALKIFNRWGELVYSRENFGINDPAAGWDGRVKGTELGPDVYVYTCEVVCMNNEILTFRGDVTLLR